MGKIPITRYEFHRVSSSDLVIFDKTGAEVLIDCDLPLSPYILCTRREKINLNLRTLFHSISKFLTTRERRLSYCFAMIKQLSPKVVLSFIDNDPLFHRLSNIFPNIQFIAVQNGWRFPDIPNPLNIQGKFNSHLLCFGQNEIVNYERRGVQFQTLLPVGSLRASIYAKRQHKDRFQSQRVRQTAPPVVLISSWSLAWPRPNSVVGVPPDLSDESILDHKAKWGNDSRVFWDQFGTRAQAEGTKRNARWLLRLSQHKSLESTLSLQVALRALAGSDICTQEISHFLELGFLPSHLRAKSTEWSTYDLIRSSGIVVSGDSTVALEALGLGKRVLISQPVAGELQKPDFQLPWWLINHNYLEFSAALQQLLEMTDKDFCSRYKEAIEYYVMKLSNPSADEIVRMVVARGLHERSFAQGSTEGFEPATHAL